MYSFYIVCLKMVHVHVATLRLYNAIRIGNIDDVNDCIASGANVNGVFNNTTTILAAIVASRYHPLMIQTLQDAGAFVDAHKNLPTQIPIYVAGRKHSKISEKVFIDLLHAGANPNVYIGRGLPDTSFLFMYVCGNSDCGTDSGCVALLQNGATCCEWQIVYVVADQRNWFCTTQLLETIM